MIAQSTITVNTRGRGTYDVSEQVNAVVASSGITTGVCNVFIHHTSASLLLTENADPQVRRDIETFLYDVVPDGDPRFLHIAEGPDDMPAHVRSMLTESTLTVPVTNAGCGFGTWQGIYVYEHRHEPHTRRITVTVQGE
ncbi:MAG: secondary thiamine-phosphate synthase enzyme YjbQ [Gammaproteobacteria bacterium]|nr:secondary thiamine-phosphate synthase enzyme YjbQ [Gammaproteobacteria bacterium]